jgi:transposase InsO family protein
MAHGWIVHPPAARAVQSRLAHDFVEDRTHHGRRLRMLTIVDEFSHECLAIRVNRKLKAINVIDALSDLFIVRGIPGHIRSDNGPEFVAKAVQDWIASVGAKTAYIERGSPWENGYIESFNARLRDELLRDVGPLGDCLATIG